MSPFSFLHNSSTQTPFPHPSTLLFLLLLLPYSTIPSIPTFSFSILPSLLSSLPSTLPSLRLLPFPPLLPSLYPSFPVTPPFPPPLLPFRSSLSSTPPSLSFFPSLYSSLPFTSPFPLTPPSRPLFILFLSYFHYLTLALLITSTPGSFSLFLFPFTKVFFINLFFHTYIPPTPCQVIPLFVARLYHISSTFYCVLSCSLYMYYAKRISRSKEINSKISNVRLALENTLSVYQYVLCSIIKQIYS
jgi:hypothetical protein